MIQLATKHDDPELKLGWGERIGFGMASCGRGMDSGMALGLVADSITYGKLKTGIDAIGKGNAGASAAQKLGLGLGLGVAIFGGAVAKAGLSGTIAAQNGQ